MEQHKRKSVIVTPDDIETGMAITVHSGEVMPEQCHIHGEFYSQLKGLPLMVNAVSLPYLACLMVPTGQTVIVDVRRATLCRLSEAYVTAISAQCRNSAPEV